MTSTATHTATSPYRSTDVIVSAAQQVHAMNGAFLGDVEGMERLGWSFEAK